MSISSDLFLAILAMDAYNRGYDAGLTDGVNLDGNGNDLDGLGEAGYSIGKAAILDFNLPSGSQGASFYAIAYEITDGSGIDGLDTGDTVISYRGTDDPIADAQTGYLIGLSSANAEQGYLAAEFFQSVTATENTDPRTGDAILTGHSLGGGLAGLIGAIYEQDAIVFDNMAFEAAADDAARDLIGDVDQARYYNGLQPWAPTIGTNLAGHAVTGELLAVDRILQSTPVTYHDSHGGVRNPVDLHSQSLLVSIMFAEEMASAGALQTTWQDVGVELIDALFSQDVGLASGFSAAEIGGASSAADKMRAAIAYSVIDEGTLGLRQHRHPDDVR